MVQLPLNAVNLAEVVKKYALDPVNFAKDLFGIKHLDPWQIWFLENSISKENKPVRIAIASCHSSGKTYLSSIIALHRLLCYPESRVIITSATKNQLGLAFGGTLSKVIEQSAIKDWFIVLAESIKIRGVKDSEIKLQAWSIQRAESFQGIHPTKTKYGSVCFIADEASSIDPCIFNGWEGNMMHPNSCLIILGNPIYRRGELFDAFHSEGSQYMTLSVSALDSSFISDAWIESMKKKCGGEDTDEYRIRVLGQFPLSDVTTFIPDKLVRDAINRVVPDQSMVPIVAGVDVGVYRDASVMIVRQGMKVLSIQRWKTTDSMIVAEEIARNVTSMNIERVVIDGNGVGHGTYCRLKQLIPGIVYSVSFVQYGAKINKKYSNSRTRFWGLAKDWLEYGSIPNDKDLISEGPSLLYSFDKTLRYVLETKDLAILRGISSPDTFDAFAYSFGGADMVRKETNTKNKPKNQVKIAWN